MATATTTTATRVEPDPPFQVPAGDFWDDYAHAVQNYVDNYVRIVIDRVSFTDDVVNTDETGLYEVRITNHGPLRMGNVSIRFRGLNGTLVKGGAAIAQYESEWVFPDMVDQIGPGRSHRIGTSGDDDTHQYLHFKAPSQPADEQDLLEVVVEDFDADLEPLHNRNNGGGSGTWSAEVFPA